MSSEEAFMKKLLARAGGREPSPCTSSDCTFRPGSPPPCWEEWGRTQNISHRKYLTSNLPKDGILHEKHYK
jgi:hypothetical protein